MVKCNHLSSEQYAIIDLGSNSFHLLIAQYSAAGLQVIDKVKRKVRLAAGLDADNYLSQEAITKGLECLALFADRLASLPSKNIRIVATATVRLAKNAEQFLQQAERVLGMKVTLLSGAEEAENIYLGVAYTSMAPHQRLVFDIGGASTELIVGDHFTVKQAVSLDIGCVTFRKRFFVQNYYTNEAFEQAIAAAKNEISPYTESYQKISWQAAFGGSGTMQALAEILRYHGQSSNISLEFLYQIKQQVCNCNTLDKLVIDGLLAERKPVFASGLAILIALFEVLEVKSLMLSSGALREGLLYQMLPFNNKLNVQEMTLRELSCRFSIDQSQAQRVLAQAQELFKKCRSFWQLHDSDNEILTAACLLHEIGLSLEFKEHEKHGEYLIKHLPLIGFSPEQQVLIGLLVRWQHEELEQQAVIKLTQLLNGRAKYLLVILRLAVILSRHRCEENIPVTIENEQFLRFIFAESYLDNHALVKQSLFSEQEYLQALSIDLQVS